MTLTLTPLLIKDQAWVRALMIERWGAETVVVHDTVYLPHTLPGFAAYIDQHTAGLVTYRQQAGDCEIVTIDSLVEGAGVGSALIDAVIAEARRAGCARVWLVTTNDNLRALGFYQKRGFRLSALRPGAVDQARRLKPEIPLMGENSIPIHDELELEYRL